MNVPALVYDNMAHYDHDLPGPLMLIWCACVWTPVSPSYEPAAILGYEAAGVVLLMLYGNAHLSYRQSRTHLDYATLSLKRGTGSVMVVFNAEPFRPQMVRSN